ncbi:MAG: hypothetical protein O3A81_02770 [bacterium]|nr:hypothetical protein [bacterium]
MTTTQLSPSTTAESADADYVSPALLPESNRIDGDIQEHRGIYFFIIAHDCPDENFIQKHLRAAEVTHNGIFWPTRHDISGVVIPCRTITQETVNEARAKLQELGFKICEEYQVVPTN